MTIVTKAFKDGHEYSVGPGIPISLGGTLLATAATALSLAATPAALADGLTFTNKTTSNGLGSNDVRGVYANGNIIYAATTNGLSISSNGGTSFTNYSQANNGLANNQANGVYAIGSSIYAATSNGFSISTNGDLNWTPYHQRWVRQLQGCLRQWEQPLRCQPR